MKLNFWSNLMRRSW